MRSSSASGGIGRFGGHRGRISHRHQTGVLPPEKALYCGFHLPVVPDQPNPQNQKKSSSYSITCQASARTLHQVHQGTSPLNYL